jgi:hypothetical protein
MTWLGLVAVVLGVGGLLARAVLGPRGFPEPARRPAALRGSQIEHVEQAFSGVAI